MSYYSRSGSSGGYPGQYGAIYPYGVAQGSSANPGQSTRESAPPRLPPAAPNPPTHVPLGSGQPALHRTMSLPPNPRQQTPEWATKDKSVPLFQRFRNFLGIAKPEPVEPDLRALLGSPRLRRSSSARLAKVEEESDYGSPAPPRRLAKVEEESDYGSPAPPRGPKAEPAAPAVLLPPRQYDLGQIATRCAEAGCGGHAPTWVELQQHAYQYDHAAFRCVFVHCFETFVNVFDWRRHILEIHGGPDGTAHGARSDTPQYWASKSYPAGMVCRCCYQYFTLDGELLNHVTNTSNPKHYAYRCYERGCYKGRAMGAFEYVTLSALRSHQKQKHEERYYRS
ncbi:hypothetical protein AURDEDRAFT_130971 [Auricularia subglabra TFB-10046 SS5]|uniref:C2H2-type domain-containing protein n=1 Tax=Auricularia subglabra (strain TFB-10046 / SS5) TaxID=717982 RepID=J0LDP8_AURST|nr:hypothetical protein AURDEDRAFT_130971 [Auricularia subglabra TFB-10046 SS5]